jgi:UDP-glucuronate decarboxylase
VVGLRAGRVLVTGGAGFVGAHLVRRLLGDGHDVVVLDDFSSGSRASLGDADPRLTILCGDVRDPPDLHSQVDVIFHLACPASPVHYQRNPVKTAETCAVGSANMLRLARQQGARILLASTSEVYGDPDVHPQPESYWGNVNPVGPRSCYDEGKRCAEAMFFAYEREYRLPVRVARIFNTYGPGMLPGDGRVMSNFITQALNGGPLTVYGDGQQTRSFCYVSDLVDGLVRLMWSGVCGPVNLGNPAEVTMSELAELVREGAGGEAGVEHRPLPEDDPRRRRPDVSRAAALLGWRPTTPLAEGVAATVAYFRACSAELTRSAISG